MPLKESEIKKYSIRFAEKDEVFVWIEPSVKKKVNVKEIPLDGKTYECSGIIILANGLNLHANFRIIKSNDPLLIEDSIYTKIDDAWYKLGEPEFLEKTKLKKNDIFPFSWIPDIPLEKNKKGPFNMDFKG